MCACICCFSDLSVWGGSRALKESKLWFLSQINPLVLLQSGDSPRTFFFLFLCVCWPLQLNFWTVLTVQPLQGFARKPTYFRECLRHKYPIVMKKRKIHLSFFSSFSNFLQLYIKIQTCMYKHPSIVGCKTSMIWTNLHQHSELWSTLFPVIPSCLRCCNALVVACGKGRRDLSWFWNFSWSLCSWHIAK